MSVDATQTQKARDHLPFHYKWVKLYKQPSDRNTSPISPIKALKNSSINFNAILRMNVQKQLLDRPNNPQVFYLSYLMQCRVLLLLVRGNNEKKIIGVANFSVLQENNQAFRFHQFGLCADGEAQVELSVTYSNAFQLGVRGQIVHNFGYSPTRGNPLGQSRDKSITQDSIPGRQDYGLLKDSKAVSSAQSDCSNRPQGQLKNIKVRKNSNSSHGKPKPPNLSEYSPEQMLCHYESQIKSLVQQLQQREEWGSGMKELVQQLQAQNQLLKQIRIQQLEECEIKNLQDGIDYVSKLVHSKFQASRSAMCDSPGSSKFNQTIPGQRDITQSRDIEQEDGQEKRSLRQKRSYKDLPLLSQSQMLSNLSVAESQLQLKNKLTGQATLTSTTPQNIITSQLQKQILGLRQQRQQLYDMTQQLYTQSKKMKQERDQLLEQYRDLQQETQRIDQYLEQIKQENVTLNYENQKHERNQNAQESARVYSENQELKVRVKELERQLKESVKAIKEFKNDALSARKEIIVKQEEIYTIQEEISVKQEEINSYKIRFGQIHSTKDYIHPINNGLSNYERKIKLSVEQKQLENRSIQLKSKSNISPQNPHAYYASLFQKLMTQRKELQHSLSQIVQSRAPSSPILTLSPSKQQKVKKLQTQINKMFIQLLKNRSQIKNIKDLQRTKGEITKQVNEILAGI